MSNLFPQSHNPNWGISQNKKHPQFILAIDAEYFRPFHRPDGIFVKNFKQGLNSYPADVWLKEVQSFLVIRERQWLDERVYLTLDEEGHPAGHYAGDRDYRQLLPYCAIRQLQEDGTHLFFPYRRTKGVGESRLAGNVSIGYGGHPDLFDVVFDDSSEIDLQTTIVESAKREIFGEETIIRDSAGVIVDPQLGKLDVHFASQFIIDDTNDVGRVHVGVVMLFDLPTGWTMNCGEDELSGMPPMSASDLLTSGLPIENWTRIILEAEVAKASPAAADTTFALPS